MQRLYNIVVLFKEYLLLLFFIGISLLLLSSNDTPQIRAIRSYTVELVGTIQDVLDVIPNVFVLQNENTILRQLNINLTDEVSRLREYRIENMRLRAMLGLKEHLQFRLVPADIVGKNLTLMRNTITLSVGEENGIKPDMPIISESGIVGKIIATSKCYSIGQLMLNKDFRASAKIQRSRVDGIIVWNGGSTVQLKNVAKTLDVKVGDLVVTSEYSNHFPAGYQIGTVTSVTDKPGSLFKEILITPSVDFTTLEQVFVIIYESSNERVVLEQQTSNKH